MRNLIQLINKQNDDRGSALGIVLANLNFVPEGHYVRALVCSSDCHLDGKLS